MFTIEIITNVEGIKIINITPHELNIKGRMTGEKIIVPISGVLINAKVEEKLVKQTGDIQFVLSAFIADEEIKNDLLKFLSFKPEVIIVGSIIAAQAYLGLVYGLCLAPGFERVAPQDKLMSTVKFTTFE